MWELAKVLKCPPAWLDLDKMGTVDDEDDDDEEAFFPKATHCRNTHHYS